MSADPLKQGLTLAKHERLKSRKLLEQLFREAPTFFTHPFKVYYHLASTLGKQENGDLNQSRDGHISQRQDGHTGNNSSDIGDGRLQAGFGVSARVFKKATDRNRIKRLTREAYRIQKASLQHALESSGRKLAVFFLYTGKELPDFDLVKEKMSIALQQLEKKLAKG